MKHIVSALVLGIVMSSCGQSDETTQVKSKKAETTMELSNKEKAAALLTSLETGDQSAVGYINASNYKQHNLAVADGLEGFGAVLQLSLIHI